MNTELASLANEYDLVSAKARPQRDFLYSELGQLDEAFLLELKEEQPQWAAFFDAILRDKPHQLHPLQEELLSNFAPTFGQPYNNYGVTKFEDMTFENFEANGETLGNSYVLFENDYELSHDTEIRRNSAAGFYSTLKNTRIQLQQLICLISRMSKSKLACVDLTIRLTSSCIVKMSLVISSTVRLMSS